jgi:hypothetical protein
LELNNLSENPNLTTEISVKILNASAGLGLSFSSNTRNQRLLNKKKTTISTITKYSTAGKISN